MNDARALAVEMLANCNVEECLDKVAFMWTFGYDFIRYATNWNTVNVKALKDRLQDVTPQSNQVYQIHMYEYLIRALVKEQSLDRMGLEKLERMCIKKLSIRYGLCNKNDAHDNVIDIKLELSDKYDSCLVKRAIWKRDYR